MPVGLQTSWNNSTRNQALWMTCYVDSTRSKGNGCTQNLYLAKGPCLPNRAGSKGQTVNIGHLCSTFIETVEWLHLSLSQASTASQMTFQRHLSHVRRHLMTFLKKKGISLLGSISQGMMTCWKYWARVRMSTLSSCI